MTDYPIRMSASSVGMQMACHASANLPKAIHGWTPPEEDDTKASSQGTAMHALLEQAASYTPTEMLALAEAITYVAELRKTRRFKVITEAQGNGWWLPTNPPTKADVVLYVQDELHIIDYKFGKIPVEVGANKQGMYYALAFSPLAPKAKFVTFHIVQPLANNIAPTRFTIQELEQFALDSQAAHNAIQSGSTQFGPSDYCMFCPANPHSRGVKGKPSCPVMLKLLYPSALDEAAALLDED